MRLVGTRGGAVIPGLQSPDHQLVRCHQEDGRDIFASLLYSGRRKDTLSIFIYVSAVMKSIPSEIHEKFDIGIWGNLSRTRVLAVALEV